MTQSDPYETLINMQQQLVGTEKEAGVFSWSLNELVESVDGEVLNAQGDEAVRFTEVSTDTRTLSPQALYVAIKGEHFDGHAFVEEAVRQGASVLLVSEPVKAAVPVVLVEDTRAALGAFAHWHRRQMRLKKLIAVTGSNGKTTVKAMLFALLSQQGKTLATQGNLNNELGVPRTLLDLRPYHEYAVIEMGANHRGEIDYLTRLAEPDIALLNNASGAHLEGFGSLNGVIEAKGEIFSGLNRFQTGGVAVINTDSPGFEQWAQRLKALGVGKVRTFGTKLGADVRFSAFESGEEKIHFSLQAEGSEHAVDLPLLGRHNAMNAAASSAVARVVGISWDTIVATLSGFNGVAGRLQRHRIGSGWLIDDSYNANPESVRAAIETLVSLKGETLLCLGAMAELGERAIEDHESVADFARQAGVDRLYVLGEATRSMPGIFGTGARWFEDVAKMASAVAQAIDDGEVKHVLVKGSRSARMEKVVETLLGRL